MNPPKKQLLPLLLFLLRNRQLVKRKLPRKAAKRMTSILSFMGSGEDEETGGLHLSIVVYDLLPPGKFGAALNMFGSGVYHTSCALKIRNNPNESESTEREWAYGGHFKKGTTGIFSIPKGTAPERMGSNLRPYMTIDMGKCFGSTWQKEFGKLSKTRTRDSGISSKDPFRDSMVFCPEDATFENMREDTLSWMLPDERKAYQVIRDLQNDPDWDGTNYKLLRRNCNTFTDLLCYRLTGKHAPTWLNRAAWVATTMPCLVPEGWVNESDLNDEVTGGSRRETLVIQPPKATPMMEDPDKVVAPLIHPPRADSSSDISFR